MTEDEIKAVWEKGFEPVVTDDPSGNGSLFLAKRRGTGESPNYVLWNWLVEEDKFADTPDELLAAMKDIAPLKNWHVRKA